MLCKASRAERSQTYVSTASPMQSAVKGKMKNALIRDALDQGGPVGERPIRLAPLRHHAQPPVLERIHDGIGRVPIFPVDL